MAWTVSASGTQLGSIGSEQILATDTTNASYYFEVDLGNLATGDILELRVYVVTLSGGTLRVAWKHTYGPVIPISKISPSPAQPSDQNIQVSLKQTAGVARNWPWKLIRS